MNYQGSDQMGVFGFFTRPYRWWKDYVLAAACDSLLNEWQREKPEYVDKVRRWIDTAQIPNDHDLQMLCRVYEERERAILRRC
jgi:hypothetical protein